MGENNSRNIGKQIAWYQMRLKSNKLATDLNDRYSPKYITQATNYTLYSSNYQIRDNFVEVL